MSTSGTTAQRVQWATDLLSRGGWPTSQSNLIAVVAWTLQENGWWGNSDQYNPLNTTQPLNGSHGTNSVGVQSYNSYDDGLTATIKTLNNGYYPQIVAALAAGTDPAAVLTAVAHSPWGTSAAVLNNIGAATTIVTGAPGATPTPTTGSLFINNDGTALGNSLVLVDPISVLPDPKDDLDHTFRAAVTAGSLVLADGTDLSAAISGGTVSLSVSQVSQITIIVEDPGLAVYRALESELDVAKNPLVTFAGDTYQIARVEIGQGNATEQFTIVLRSAAAEAFQQERSGGAGSGTAGEGANLQDALALLCALGPGGLRRDFKAMIDTAVPNEPVTRQGAGDANPATIETTWSMFQRTAAMVRGWFFEDRGTFYCGRPSWLVTVRPQLKVGWGTGWGGDDTLRSVDCPDVSAERDEIPPCKHLRVSLPRERGEQVRPGYRLNLEGISAKFDGAYIVTDVTWELDGATTPAVITAQEPVDPFPTDPSQFGTPGSNNSGTNIIATPVAPGATGSGAAPGSSGFVWPVHGPVSQEFGANPSQHQPNGHIGIDISVQTGTTVFACGNGTVNSTTSTLLPTDSHASGNPPFQGYGNAVLIDHLNGIQSLYGHLQSVSVQAGQTIVQGQPIGVSNNTGYSTGPHLHFEMRHNSTPVNPRSLVSGNPS